MHSAPNQLGRVPAYGQGRSVAKLITGEHLRAALADGGFIKNGAPSSVEGAKYDFRMSPIILKSSFGSPVNLANLTEEQRALVRVEPGEVVFVRTIERLELPNTVTAVLSTKRKLSHQGIIALGGFCIDPLYKGPLFVGLYNFSSTPFPLQSGKKLIAALFYELSGDEVTDFPTPESVPDDDFPDELKNLIRNYKPVELKGLTEALSTLHAQFLALQDEVRDDRTWKRDFRDALDQQTKQIDKLLEGLQEEKEARKGEDVAIRSKLEGMSSLFTTARVVWTIIWTIAALLIGAFLGPYISRLVQAPSREITSPAPVPSPPQPPPIIPAPKQ
jgi:deoxycytidine triphosphate deaminase